MYKEQKFISYSSGGLAVQDQGADTGVWWGFSPFLRWYIAALSSHGRGWKGKSPKAGKPL
jgi:hypothetical protein